MNLLLDFMGMTRPQSTVIAMLAPPSMFDRPSTTADSIAPLDNYVQPNMGHALRIWWAFFWPTTLVSTFLSIVITVLVKLIYEDTNMSAKYLALPLRYNSYIVGYIVAFFGMYYILHKKFRRFRIRLLPKGAAAGTAPLAANFQRALRVWWTFTWRTFLYGLVAWVVVILPLTWFLGIFQPTATFVSLFFTAVGIVVSGAVALFVIYSNILDEDLGDFRVCLLPREVIASSPVAPAADLA